MARADEGIGRALHIYMRPARTGACPAVLTVTWNTLRDEVPRQATRGFFFPSKGQRLLSLDTCGALPLLQPNPPEQAERLYGHPERAHWMRPPPDR
ncbi:MAG: hypothetical protein WKG00_27880 [Polyangiaceae bacterium]